MPNIQYIGDVRNMLLQNSKESEVLFGSKRITVEEALSKIENLPDDGISYIPILMMSDAIIQSMFMRGAI